MSTLAIPDCARAVQLHGKVAAGRIALVDETDFGIVSQYRWWIRETRREGRLTSAYPVTIIYPGGVKKSLTMHSLITGWPLTDHKDHNGLNNQRSNLRPGTQSQNCGNARKTKSPCSSRYKGVSWKPEKRKWRAYIRLNARQAFLGYFANEVDAARAYDEAARQVFGEFACPNFPTSGRESSAA